jgi:hypothetical protein
VSTYPAKIKAIQEWSIPKTVKEFRGFLGLTGYYIKFVKHFEIIANPLTDLLCKDVQFSSGPIHSNAFKLLKDALTSTPCLALPDFDKPFHIETNACAVGVGVVLL